MSKARPQLAAVSIALLVCSAGCQGDGSKQVSDPPSDPSATATPSASRASAPSDGLTGVGALDSAWDATHTQDLSTGAEPGAAYNADAVSHDGEMLAQYYAVNHNDGRVTAFSERFTDGTTFAMALAALRRNDLPADAVLLWSADAPTCRVLQFRSRTVMAIGAEAHGGITVALVSGIDQSSYDTLPFNPRRIADATVGLYYEAERSADC